MCHECQLVWQMMTLELFLFFIIQAVKDSSTAEVNSVALDARRRDTNLIKNVNQSIRSCNRNFMSFFFKLFFFLRQLTGHCTNSFIVCTSFSIWYKPVSFLFATRNNRSTWLHSESVKYHLVFFSRFSNYWAKGQYVDRILFKGFFTFLRL